MDLQMPRAQSLMLRHLLIPAVSEYPSLKSYYDEIIA